MTDVEIMQRFINTTEAINEMRVTTARIETKVDNLIVAQARCVNHGERIKALEVTTGKLAHNFKWAAWLVGIFFTAAGLVLAIFRR